MYFSDFPRFFLLNFLEKNQGNLQNLQKLFAYFQEAGEQGHSECNNNNTGICRKSADFYNLALNFYRCKTFVIFKSVTFEIFLKIMESVEDDANSVFHQDQKFFKSDTFENDTCFVTFKSVTFVIFRKCSESVNFDVNNDLQEDLKIFKSDTFEN